MKKFLILITFLLTNTFLLGQINSNPELSDSKSWEYEFKGSKNGELEQIYRDSDSYVISQNENTIVICSANYHWLVGGTFANVAELVLTIKNTSDKNILFDPSKIKVKSKDKKKKKSKTLSHLSKQKIQDKFDKQQMWDDVLTGLAVLGEALDDSPTSTSETSGSIAGDLFNATTESFSEKDKEESIDNLIDDAEQSRNQSIKTERSLNDIIIGKTTIFPGETITGSVLIHYNWDFKKAYYIDFDIILDEDTHNFSYKATGRV
tara:strand:- start:611 stop:1399 length:789 start_codon:yes stop_codon:yes gene_type:complete